MPARNAAPQKPMTPVVLLVTAVAVVTGVAYGLPGLLAAPIGMFIASMTYPPVQATGKKDSQGIPQPANPTEAAKISRWRYWSGMRTAMFSGLNPGWPLRFSWFGTMLAAVAAYLLAPIDPTVATGQFQALAPVLENGQVLNAIGAALALAGIDRAGRMRGDVPSPGVTHDAVLRAIKSTPARLGISAGIGMSSGLALAGLLEFLRPVWSNLAPRVEVNAGASFTLAAISGLLLGAYAAVRAEALARHKRLSEGTAQWRPRWAQLKEDPAPRLVDRVEMASGPIVDTFDADGSRGAQYYIQMALKIAPTLGAGMSCMVLDVPDIGSDGQPIEGTRHPLRFDVVLVPAGWGPDVMDPATPEEDVALAARMALATACDEGGLAPRYVFTGVTRLTPAPATKAAAKRKIVDTTVEGQVLAWDQTPETTTGTDEEHDGADAGPQAWALNWARPGAAGANEFRTRSAGIFAGIVQAPTLVDHRANNQDGLCVFGALEPQAWENDLGVDDTWVYRTAGEDDWNSKWSQAHTKIGPNPPVPQWDVESDGQLADGTVVHQMAFMSRLGVTVDQLFEVEKAFPTVLNAAPFVSMTGWDGGTGRAGDRHQMAVTLHWSSRPVPTRPDDLKPVPGSDAPKWVLAGLLNQAFKDARLARPELASATALTKPASRKAIWKMHVRIFGGNLSMVRNQLHAIRQSWGTEWVRMEAAQDGLYLVAGGEPSSAGVLLANPRRDKKYLASLDWAQVFADSGLSGIDGRLPKLLTVDHLEHNPQVEVLEFDLEGTGLSYGRFREARDKLQANSSKAYVEPRPVKNRPDSVILYASKEHPMPELALHEWETIDASTGYPFATNVEGEPVEFSPKNDIHLMVVGGSGSGKSVILQSLMTGALRRGHDLYVGDPTKGAADFLFAEPYAKAMTRDLLGTLGMMRGLYQEVKRRVVVNSAAGVGNYRDLPEQGRPNHILLVLDEFVSMISPDHVSRTPSDDPEVELERERAIAENAAKAEIGAITGKIAREARSAGVTMLLATQKLTAKDLDSIPGGSSLKVNLSRLIAGKTTHGERMSALKDASNAPDLGEHVPKGRAIFESVTAAPVMVQTWYTPAEQAALGEYVAKHRAPLAEDQKLDVAAYTPKLRGQEELEADSVDLDPFAAVNAEAEVVDVGELELTLDDLEITLDDLEDDDPDPVPGEDPAPPVPEGLDWAALTQGQEDPQPAPAAGFAAEVAEHLLAHGGDYSGPVVLAGVGVSGLGGGPVLPVELAEHRAAGEDVWWPAEALQGWLDEDPSRGEHRILFADAGLDGLDPVFEIPNRDLAADVLEGTDHLLLSPHTDWQDQLHHWLTATAGPTQDTAPVPAPGPEMIPAPDAPDARGEEQDADELPEPPPAWLLPDEDFADDRSTAEVFDQEVFDQEALEDVPLAPAPLLVPTVPDPVPAPAPAPEPVPVPAGTSNFDDDFDDDFEVPDRVRRARELRERVLRGEAI